MSLDGCDQKPMSETGFGAGGSGGAGLPFCGLAGGCRSTGAGVLMVFRGPATALVGAAATGEAVAGAAVVAVGAAATVSAGLGAGVGAGTGAAVVAVAGAATVGGERGLVTTGGDADAPPASPLSRSLVATPAPMPTTASAASARTTMVLRGVRVIGDGVCVMGAPVCRAGAGVIAGDGVVAANGLWPGRAGVPPEYDPSAYCSPELGVSGVVRPHTV